MFDRIMESLQDFVYILQNPPPFTEKNALFYILNTIIFIIVFNAVRMLFRLLLNKQNAHIMRAYTSTQVKDKKILILGDSTAVGTGASSPNDTIAGRLARDFPNSQVINLGKNGGLIRDLKDQIATVRDQKFDMIIISAGGNDVWHFTRLYGVRKLLAEVLREATRMSDYRVLFFLYNNIGDAPIFPSFIQFFLKRRCDKIQGLIKSVAAAAHVPTIDLFTHDTHNPFLENPNELFASDGIHPSSRGYTLWYNRMWLTMVENGFRHDI